MKSRVLVGFLFLIISITNAGGVSAETIEAQNWLYVSGNSPKVTRTSVATGNSTGFGVTNIQNITIGSELALTNESVHVIDSQGRIWGWGSDGREVGTGEASPVAQPKIIPTTEVVTQISSGDNHTIALGKSGRIYGWGWNGHGQLGMGGTEDYSTSWQHSSPVQINIPGDRSAKFIAASGWQSFAIATDNTIWGWGINQNYSILGTGGYSSVYTPTLIRVPNGFVPIKIATNGGRYTLVLSRNGGVIGWGSNGNGGNGLGVSGEINSPTLIFPETASIIDIAVNGAATYVLNSNGIVYSAGYNGFGQLGSTYHPGGNSFAKVALPSTFIAKKIFAANSNAWAVSANGQSYTWGAGSNDTLGTGYTGTVFTPILLSTLNDYAILNVAGNYTQTFAIVSNQPKIKAAADKAAADKAAAEVKAKQEADAIAAAAQESIDAANAATDAANIAAEAQSSAVIAALDSADEIAALSGQVDEIISVLKSQIIKLSALIVKIQSKVGR
jgi:alpha-tubulin suppressor-like RCC1 family protein